MKKELVQFPGLELRAGEDEGIVEGYIAVWGTVDSYMSEFQRGSFAKTIEERGNRIKLLFNHNEESVIGKVVEIREDDNGVFVRARITRAVQQANDVFELIKDDVIDTFSFGFRAIKQTFRAGVRVITEVKLYEVSPVVFEANENAVITDVRRDKRATDFDESLSSIQLFSERNDLIGAINVTLEDVFYDFLYGDSSAGDALQQTNDTLVKFSALYSDFTERLINTLSERNDIDFTNPVAKAMANEFSGKSVDEVASTTSLTADEVRALRAGRVVASDNLPDNIGKAAQQVRNEAVDTLCSELRDGGYNTAEMERIAGIIDQSLSPKGEVDNLITDLRNFRINLETRSK